MSIDQDLATIAKRTRYPVDAFLYVQRGLDFTVTRLHGEIDDFEDLDPEEHVRVDPKYFRPTEVDLLIGDPTKAKEKLGWEPKYDLEALIKDMISADLEVFKKDKYLLEGGHKILNQAE